MSSDAREQTTHVPARRVHTAGAQTDTGKPRLTGEGTSDDARADAAGTEDTETRGHGQGQGRSSVVQRLLGIPGSIPTTQRTNQSGTLNPPHTARKQRGQLASVYDADKSTA